MTDGEIAEYIGQCASGLQLAHRRNRDSPIAPPRIRVITSQAISAGRAVIWIVTGSDELPASYRFTFWARVTPEGRQLITESLAVVDRMGVNECSYWDMPGIVRDLGITVGQRALNTVAFAI